MKIDTYFTPAEVDPAVVAGRTALVVDVIRATSTIVEALAGGAKAIYPTVSTEDAIRLATSLGREDTLLCGERRGLKVEGFDLGNSPREFDAERVGGKRLVMSTTNGTRALLAAQGARRVVVLALTNLSEVVRAVAADGDLVVICAGKEDRFSLDDALCAGLLLRDVTHRAGRDGVILNDQATAALSLGEAFEPDEGFLRRTAAGAALVDIGLEADLSICADLDRHALIPEMRDRTIRL